MLRSALLILSGNAFSSALSLIRNLLVARLLPVEDYGIAATFATAMAIVEMASALGLQQQLIQHRRGDDPDFQAALQGFALLRGLMNGLLLFLIAPLFAAFLEVPELVWAYQLLAIVPVLNSLTHFDIVRMNRQLRFLPAVVAGTLPTLVGLLLVWPLAYWLGDWRIMLYSIIAQATIGVVASHLLAERPFRLRFDRAVMAGSLRFGWPLMTNAVLMFLIFNAERLIIGREFGLAALGIFSMGMTLTLTPTLVLSKSIQSMFLPVLTNAVPEPARFQRRAIMASQLPLLFGAALVLGTVLLGESFVALVLGEHFAPLVPLLAPLAVIQAIRVLKIGPSTVALARAQTANAMIANSIRALLIPLGWYLAHMSNDIMPLIYCAVVGEAAGAVVAYLLVSARAGVNLRPMAVPLAIFALMMICAFASAEPTLAAFHLPAFIGMTACFALLLATLHDVRHYLSARILRRRGTG